MSLFRASRQICPRPVASRVESRPARAGEHERIVRGARVRRRRRRRAPARRRPRGGGVDGHGDAAAKSASERRGGGGGRGRRARGRRGSRREAVRARVRRGRGGGLETRAARAGGARRSRPVVESSDRPGEARGRRGTKRPFAVRCRHVSFTSSIDPLASPSERAQGPSAATRDRPPAHARVLRYARTAPFAILHENQLAGSHGGFINLL